MNFLYTISLPLLAGISIVVAVALSLGGLALFHRAVNKDHLREGHDVAGFVYAVVGVVPFPISALVPLRERLRLHNPKSKSTPIPSQNPRRSPSPRMLPDMRKYPS